MKLDLCLFCFPAERSASQSGGARGRSGRLQAAMLGPTLSCTETNQALMRTVMVEQDGYEPIKLTQSEFWFKLILQHVTDLFLHANSDGFHCRTNVFMKVWGVSDSLINSDVLKVRWKLSLLITKIKSELCWESPSLYFDLHGRNQYKAEKMSEINMEALRMVFFSLKPIRFNSEVLLVFTFLCKF